MSWPDAYRAVYAWSAQHGHRLRSHVNGVCLCGWRSPDGTAGEMSAAGRQHVVDAWCVAGESCGLLPHGSRPVVKSIIDGFDGTYNDLIDTVNGILDGSFKGWLAHTEDGDHVHVTPFNDLLEHEVDDDGSCVCGPTIEPAPRNNGSYGWSIIHHTLDGRESAES